MAPVQLPVLSSEFPDSWDIWLRLGVPAPVEGLSPARKGGVAEVESSKRVFSTPTSGVSSRLPRIITESKRSGDTRSDECPNMPFVPRGILLREKKKGRKKNKVSPNKYHLLWNHQERGAIEKFLLFSTQSVTWRFIYAQRLDSASKVKAGESYAFWLQADGLLLPYCQKSTLNFS